MCQPGVSVRYDGKTAAVLGIRDGVGSASRPLFRVGKGDTDGMGLEVLDGVGGDVANGDGVDGREG